MLKLWRMNAPELTGALMAVAGATVGLSTALAGDLPVHDGFELQVRSDFSGAYNVPDGSSYNSGTVALGSNHHVAMRLITVGFLRNAGLWSGQWGLGGVAYTAPTGPVCSDASVNAAGDVVFEQYDFGSSDGVRKYDPVTGMTTTAIAPGGPFGVTNLGSPQINDAGQIGFRGKSGGGAYSFIVDDAGVQTRLVAQVEIVPSSPYSFLFTPAFNNDGDIAGKARVGGPGQVSGSQPDEVRIWHGGGGSTLVAIDDDGDPRSPYSGFDNSVGFAEGGLVAFTASLTAGGRGVFLFDGTDIITIATEADPMVSSIEFFSPEVNASGVVAFRAKNGAGLRAVFIGNGRALEAVITEHDELLTDQGLAVIDRPDSSPVFGGGIAINDAGAVAFTCSLADASNPNSGWGSGVFVATVPATPGDLDGNGVVDAADLALLLSLWGHIGSVADINDDGIVDAGDLAILLSNWS